MSGKKVKQERKNAMCCGNCAFGVELEVDKRFVLCHAARPQVVVARLPEGMNNSIVIKGGAQNSGGLAPLTMWPMTGKDDWCGDFTSHEELIAHLRSRFEDVRDGGGGNGQNKPPAAND